MAMTKKSAVTVAEELRVLNKVVDDKEMSNLADIFTPDFWATISAALTNLVTVAVLLGWVNSDVEGVTQAIIALIGAAEVIALNSMLIWRYLSARQAARAQLIDARFRYIESIAIEKLRAGL
jgi:hypothetical protein